MKATRGKIAALLCALGMLLLPAIADAANLKGETSQAGKRIGLRTADDGSVDFARISWKASCRFGGAVSATSRFATFDRSSPAGFRAAARDKTKDGRYKVDVRVRLEGAVKGTGYAGTFKASARYTKHGKYVSTCRTGKVRWSAKPR
jgi:hypothetical protein